MCNAHLFLLQNTRTPNISGHSNKAKCPLYIILLPLQYPRLERGSCCEITVNICYFTCLINMSHLKFLRRKNCHAGVFRTEKHPHGSFFFSRIRDDSCHVYWLVRCASFFESSTLRGSLKVRITSIWMRMLFFKRKVWHNGSRM